MFIDKLKHQYRAYWLFSFGIGLPHVIEVLQGSRILAGLTANVFMISVLAFLLYCIGFCIGRLVNRGRTYFSKSLKEGER